MLVSHFLNVLLFACCIRKLNYRVNDAFLCLYFSQDIYNELPIVLLCPEFILSLAKTGRRPDKEFSINIFL